MRSYIDQRLVDDGDYEHVFGESAEEHLRKKEKRSSVNGSKRRHSRDNKDTLRAQRFSHEIKTYDKLFREAKRERATRKEISQELKGLKPNVADWRLLRDALKRGLVFEQVVMNSFERFFSEAFEEICNERADVLLLHSLKRNERRLDWVLATFILDHHRADIWAFIEEMKRSMTEVMETSYHIDNDSTLYHEMTFRFDCVLSYDSIAQEELTQLIMPYVPVWGVLNECRFIISVCERVLEKLTRYLR